MDTETVLRAQVREAGRWWWLFVVTGVIWLMVGLVVLRFTETSVTTVGVLIGVVFTVAAITEFMEVAMRSGGWKFVHALLGVIFVLGAIWGFTNPKNAFWALAEVLGFILVIYGVIEITGSVVVRDINPLWWLGLAMGILLVLLGFWTGQQLVTVKAQLLIFYVGLFALFRGFAQVVLAFELRHAGRELTDV